MSRSSRRTVRLLYETTLFVVVSVFDILPAFLAWCNGSPLAGAKHLVVNGASDLLHELFGKDGYGFHARSAVGFAQLPTGVAVEVEAIFEVAQ